MKASLLNKLDALQDRFEELTALLGDAEVISNQTQFRAYSKEYAEVEPVVAAFRQLRKVQDDLEGAHARLMHAGARCLTPPEECEGVRMGLYEDPDGFNFTLAQAS